MSKKHLKLLYVFQLHNQQIALVVLLMVCVTQELGGSDGPAPIGVRLRKLQDLK